MMLQGRLVEGRKIVTLASMNFPPLVSSVVGATLVKILAMWGSKMKLRDVEG
jgi:hypothetical protein